MSESTYSRDDLQRIYRKLRLTRRAEEEIARLYPSDSIKSPIHLSLGQESVSVGVCDTLGQDDAVAMTYRGHAAYLAKGGDLNAMFAELYGKATGCGGGKSGSMHLVDMAHQVIGTSAVVGTTIPVALGFALAFKHEGKGRVVVTFFGDGASEEGVFSESVNYAALAGLPVLFVMENNGLAIHSPLSKRWATDLVCERIRTYGISAERIEDGDVFAIRDAAHRALDAMRGGGGPAFLECVTYRWSEHVGPGEDFDEGYRDRSELKLWMERDAVKMVGRMLKDSERQAIDKTVEKELEAAVSYAENSPFPEADELFDHVYSG